MFEFACACTSEKENWDVTRRTDDVLERCVWTWWYLESRQHKSGECATHGIHYHSSRSNLLLPGTGGVPHFLACVEVLASKFNLQVQCLFRSMITSLVRARNSQDEKAIRQTVASYRWNTHLPAQIKLLHKVLVVDRIRKQIQPVTKLTAVSMHAVCHAHEDM